MSRTSGRVGDACVSSVTRRRGGTFGCEEAPTAVIGGIRPTSVVVVLAREPEAVARERLTRGIRGRSFDVLLACFASSVGADAAILLGAPDAAGPRAIASWGLGDEAPSVAGIAAGLLERAGETEGAAIEADGDGVRAAAAVVRAHACADRGSLRGLRPAVGAAARGARLGGRVLRAPRGAVHVRGRHGRGRAGLGRVRLAHGLPELRRRDRDAARRDAALGAPRAQRGAVRVRRRRLQAAQRRPRAGGRQPGALGGRGRAALRRAPLRRRRQGGGGRVRRHPARDRRRQRAAGRRAAAGDGPLALAEATAVPLDASCGVVVWDGEMAPAELLDGVTALVHRAKSAAAGGSRSGARGSGGRWRA